MSEHLSESSEEGWYTDPYGRHEARWMSSGKPTRLVRDSGVESYDEPPTGPPTRTTERIYEIAVGDGNDLKRADDAERQNYDPKAETRAAWDAFDESGP